MRGLVVCKSQLEFRDGGSMCTTASLCMGIAIMSGKMNPITDLKEELIESMNDVMDISSKAHKKTSQKLSKGTSTSICTGIQEIMDSAGLKLDGFGLQSYSYIISPFAGQPSFSLTDGKKSCLEINNSNKKTPLLYVPAHDLLPPEVVPELLIEKDSYQRQDDKNNNGGGVIAILTSAGHSVLLMNSPSCAGYGHFDPLSGQMMTGVSRNSLIRFICANTRGQEISDLYIITQSGVKKSRKE